MAALYDGEHAGWIYKQGSMIKNWKKRFMVLRGKQLTYYDTAQLNPRVKEKGSFQVITVERSSDINNGLLVHGRGGRVLKLYTDSAELTNGWYTAIMDATTTGGSAMNMGVSAADRLSSISGSNNGESVDLDDQLDLLDRLESLPIEDTIEQVQHQGWLTKEGMRVKNWKRRYFTLRGDTLSYYNSEDTGSQAKGFGHVRAVEVNGEKPNSLDVRFDNGRILRVCAQSAEDMQEWLCMLSDAIEAVAMDNNNARQSMAIRQSMRASMSVSSKPPRPSSSQMPSRHSMHSMGSNGSAPTTRQSMGSLPTKNPASSLSQLPRQMERERSRSGNSSYQSSRLSFSQQSSIASSDNQNDDIEYESDDSEGDWI